MDHFYKIKFWKRMLFMNSNFCEMVAKQSQFFSGPNSEYKLCTAECTVSIGMEQDYKYDTILYILLRS